jgi:hypothetical protein
METHMIFGPQQGASFTATQSLSIGTHPESSDSWPAWAEVAIVHTIEASADLYITYSSDASLVATPYQRGSLCGLSIEPVRLFFWDWGPTEIDIADHIGVDRAPAHSPTSMNLIEA